MRVGGRYVKVSKTGWPVRVLGRDVADSIGITVRIEAQACGDICHSGSFTKEGLSPGI